MLRNRTRGPARPALLLLALGACGPAGEVGQDPAARPAMPGTLPVLHHDFGTIPHGEAREHEFAVDVRGALGEGWLPLRVLVDCSCAKAAMHVRGAGGEVRPLAPGADPANAVRPGELLIVRMQLDSLLREPVDFGPADSRGSLLLQHVDDRTASRRVQWPLHLRYAIDSPVRLRPFAVLDFERVPRSAAPGLVLSLAGDVPGREVRFGPARCDDPRLDLRLEGEGNTALLRARFAPGAGPPGSFRLLVTVDTDLPDGYRVQIAATGKVVEDLEAVPIPKLALYTDLRVAQTEAQAQSQFLLVTDHDRRRPAEFSVARLVDAAGRDARSSFEVRFEPVPGDDRTRRMFVRYLGGLSTEFRGELVLAKDPADGPFLAIELVALDAPQPP